MLSQCCGILCWCRGDILVVVVETLSTVKLNGDQRCLEFTNCTVPVVLTKVPSTSLALSGKSFVMNRYIFASGKFVKNLH